jgi:multisubunit Na+/H+ antiporter MnhF subunit
MVETVGIRQVMRFIRLESAKDRVIGVDTLGVTTCPVWNGLLTNLGYCGKCALLG